MLMLSLATMRKVSPSFIYLETNSLILCKDGWIQSVLVLPTMEDLFHLYVLMFTQSETGQTQVFRRLHCLLGIGAMIMKYMENGSEQITLLHHILNGVNGKKMYWQY